MDKRGKNILFYFLYAVFIVIIIASAAMIWPVYRKHQKIKDYVGELNDELKRKTAEAVELNKLVHELENDPDAIEKVARERFGMCKPGEAVLKYENDKDKESRTKAR